MNQEDKKAFRKTMLLKRDAIPYETRTEADNARNECIRNWESYKSADLLLFYVSYRSEADTLQLIKEALEAGCKVAVPKVVGTDMVFYRITDISLLVEGYKGILEPDTGQCEAITGDLPKRSLLFVPGCAFDEAGGRMGYGGGFYDRFIEQYPDVLRVALAYEEQIVEEVPREVHDKPVDAIVTEKRLLKVSQGVSGDSAGTIVRRH